MKDEMKPQPIGHLVPGRIYVVKGWFKTLEDKERFHADLQRQVPECKFLVVDGRCEFVSAPPAKSGKILSSSMLEWIRGIRC